MILGIVGSEAAKFTPASEALARIHIRTFIVDGGFDHVTSGACHLGGIDSWAIEEAQRLGLETTIFPPKTRAWTNGYKPRNIQIATLADHMLCLTVDRLPPSYTGMVFPLCYHCGTKDHVKSGGCWTVKHARSLGKPGTILVVGNM